MKLDDDDDGNCQEKLSSHFTFNLGAFLKTTCSYVRKNVRIPPLRMSDRIPLLRMCVRMPLLRESIRIPLLRVSDRIPLLRMRHSYHASDPCAAYENKIVLRILYILGGKNGELVLQTATWKCTANFFRKIGLCEPPTHPPVPSIYQIWLRMTFLLSSKLKKELKGK
jgi:hypothetical protein